MTLLRSALILLLFTATAWPQLHAFGQHAQAVLAKPQCKAGDFSILISDANSGETLFASNPQQPLIPASNMKLVTTAAAVHYLAPNFVYKTIAGIKGPNLVIFGAGDPLLGDPVIAKQYGQTIDTFLAQIAAELRHRGITAIQGDMLIDDTIFDEVRFHPSWPLDQAMNWYCAQVSGVCYNDNCIDIRLLPTEPGSPARYELTPATRYFDITNRTKTVAAGKSTCWAWRNGESCDVTLRGNVRSEQIIYATVDRPTAYFGMVLAEYLQRQGITIKGHLVVMRLRDERGAIPADIQPLCQHETPLIDVMRRANERSLNLAAEALLKTIGNHYASKLQNRWVSGSWQNGAQAVTAFLQQRGCNPPAFHIDDGSGLSHENRLSAMVLTEVLRSIYQQPEMFDKYRDTLAKPGTGTLRRRFLNTPVQDRLYAKTGYVNGAWALSGYYHRENGNWIVFSVIANRTQGGSLRSCIDDIIAKLNMIP